MAQTLLDIVQDILSSMDSDEVNSISDNPESLQVATLVKRVYEDVTSRIDFREHKNLFEMEASLDAGKPTIMYKPERVRKIDWIKYNDETIDDTNDKFVLVEYVDPLRFMDLMHSLAEDDDDVLKFTYTIGTDTIDIMCRTDRAPTLYTNIDDHTYLFNSYDSEVDSTLQKTKSLAYGALQPAAFSLTDTFTFDLEPSVMALLFQEVKSTAWADMKQSVNAKAENSARKQWIHNQSNFSSPIESPNYGRRRR